MKNINNYLIELHARYLKSKKRVFFLDYDGTLASIQLLPEMASPTNQIKALLRKLANDLANEIIIVSGRDHTSLEKWLGDLPITLVAEHGAFVKQPNHEWQKNFPALNHWKESVLPALETIVKQHPGSFIEDKHYSLVWHYRTVQNEIPSIDKEKFFIQLNSLSTTNEFLVYDEDCTLEIRTVGINKGKFASHFILNHRDIDFILAMGDGKTDEDLFEAVGKNNVTIKIGIDTESSAVYFLEKQEDVPHLIQYLLDGIKKGEVLSSQA